MTSVGSTVMTTAPLISLDQTLILFDVDQPENAKQTITITKVSSHNCVGWRVLTNAPTRYIVKPNSGILVQKEKMTIELVKNRFNPRHLMVIEAIGFADEKRWPVIWQKQLASDEMYIVELELSTTLVNIDSATHLTDGGQQSLTLIQMMEMSQTRGAERVTELQKVLYMLTTDNRTIEKNQQQIEKLKRVLNKQIAAKMARCEEIGRKTTELELQKKSLFEEEQIKVKQQMQTVVEMPNPSSQLSSLPKQNCSLM